jgi:hypothetical protein
MSFRYSLNGAPSQPLGCPGFTTPARQGRMVQKTGMIGRMRYTMGSAMECLKMPDKPFPGPTAPAFTVFPTATESAGPHVGSLFTCDPGAVSGFPYPTVTEFRWDTAAGNVYGSTYTALIGDVGYAVTCTVTWTNTVSTASSPTPQINVT